MPMVVWTSLFMEAQGYEVKYNIVYRDNKGPILMAKKVKASSGKS